MTWNNRNYNTPCTNKGGDCYDRTNAAQGNAPYSLLTFEASVLPDNRYYDLDVQGYVNDTYSNTGFFLKAKDENDNYIAFYSSEWSNASQRLKLIINYTTCGTFSPYDVDHNGYVNEADLDIIRSNFCQITYSPYPPYDVTG